MSRGHRGRGRQASEARDEDEPGAAPDLGNQAKLGTATG